MFKKLSITIICLIALIFLAVFIYRYQIMQYSAEAFVRSILPHYVKIDQIGFEFKNNRIFLKGLKLENPPGFSDKYLLEIEEVVSRYKLRGKTMFDGIEVSEPLFREPVFHIERMRDGRVNLNEMWQVLGIEPKKDVPEEQVKEAEPVMAEPAEKPKAKNRLSDTLRLPESFIIRGGKVVFVDGLPLPTPHIITFENANAKLSVKLDEAYSSVLGMSTSGKGEFNGHKDQTIEWNVSFNPATPKLTMSNRFEVSNVDLLALEPYYDKYSPLTFKSGRFSGTLVFDFDNGNIGSTNEIKLSRLEFFVKKGFENAIFWETTVPDLVKYFSSSFGDIVFDFKIKGEMSDPKFFLGPISRQAITAMALDKVATVLKSATSESESKEMDKVKEYIDFFKGFLNKK